jgi:Zn-dependent protease with chaperone function
MEYAADKYAVSLTSADSMIRALQKIDDLNYDSDNMTEQNEIMSTHPSTKKRILRLNNLSNVLESV